MLTRIVAALCLVALSAGAGIIFAGDPPKPGETGKLTFVTDEENVVASEIWGAWEMDADLTTRLTQRPPREGQTLSLDFKKSDKHTALMTRFLEKFFASVEKKADARLDELKRACTLIYASGELAVIQGERAESFAFILVNYRGNPYVIILENEVDLESFNVMLARDLKGDGDLLFVGGDYNNQSFTALKRKK